VRSLAPLTTVSIEAVEAMGLLALLAEVAGGVVVAQRASVAIKV